MTDTTTPAAPPATIKQLVQQAQTALADVFFRLELLTNNREHEISTLANQTLGDLRAVVNAHDAMERWCWSQDAQGAGTDAPAAPAIAAPGDHARGNAIRAYCNRLEQASLRLGGAAGTAEVLGCAFQFGHEYAFSDAAAPASCEFLARELGALKDLIHEVINEASTVHRAEITAAAAAWIAAEQEETA